MSKSNASSKSAGAAPASSAEALAKLRSQGRFVGVFLGGMVGWLILQTAARYLLTNLFKTSHYVEWTATLLGAAIGFFVGGAAAKLLVTHNERRLVRPFGLAVSLVFLVMWILPITWVGGSKKSTPGMPYYMQNLHRISCLFTHSSKDWKTVHYQIKFKGSDEWVEGFEPGIFPQSIFGYRGRFNRIIGQSLRGGARGGGRRWEVAKHIQTRWAELYPNDPPITHVRYIRVVHPVFESHCMANEPWQKLPLAVYPQNQWRFEDTIDLTKPYRYKPKPTKKRRPTPKKSTADKKAAAKKAAAAKGKSAPKGMLVPSTPKANLAVQPVVPAKAERANALQVPRPLKANVKKNEGTK